MYRRDYQILIIKQIPKCLNEMLEIKANIGEVDQH